MPYTKYVLSMLENSDCYYVRKGKGNYSLWFNPNAKILFRVDHVVVTHFSANDIMRQAGLSKITNYPINNSYNI